MKWPRAAASVVVIGLAFLCVHLLDPHGGGDPAALPAPAIAMPASGPDDRHALAFMQPQDWANFEMRTAPDVSGTEQENEERFLRYDRSLRPLLRELEPGPVFAKDRTVCLDAVYSRFLALEPEFKRLPWEIQKGFLEIEFKYEGDRSVLTKFERIHKLASDWGFGR